MAKLERTKADSQKQKNRRSSTASTAGRRPQVRGQSRRDEYRKG